ncbi:MAG: LysE family transporter [Flavobacteriales bacterium]|nr:LysE family transporter [Flavobacteriales bacterium]
MAILIGILLGLSTLVFIGPVLLYLIKVSLENGFRGGAAVALGIIIGDVICVGIAVTGFKKIFDDENNLFWFAMVGGAILLAMGIKNIFKPTLEFDVSQKKKIKNQTLLIYFINGFALNFINPFVFAVWFGFSIFLQSQVEHDSEVLIGLVFALLVIFITDLLKAYYAKRVFSLIAPNRLKKLFKAFGFIMVLFSLRLFYYCYVI